MKMKERFKMSTIKNLLLLLFAGAFLAGCEQEVELDLPEMEDKLVVEGLIEEGVPPVIVLTRNTAFFGGIDLETVQGLFVNDADVWVSNGTQEVKLQEIAVDTLGDLEFYFYTTPLLLGTAGETYDLRIEWQEHQLFATTTIPQPVPLDSVWWEPHPSPKADTLVRIMTHYTDPPGEKNYVRYFTSINGSRYLPGLASVYADTEVDGESFDLPLDRGVDRTALTMDWDTYPYVRRGDSIIIRWAAIDEDTYQFWRSVEFQTQSTGNPFASVVRINSNIHGGLGIWAGYGSTYHRLVIPK